MAVDCHTSASPPISLEKGLDKSGTSSAISEREPSNGVVIGPTETTFPEFSRLSGADDEDDPEERCRQIVHALARGVPARELDRIVLEGVRLLLLVTWDHDGSEDFHIGVLRDVAAGRLLAAKVVGALDNTFAMIEAGQQWPPANYFASAIGKIRRRVDHEGMKQAAEEEEAERFASGEFKLPAMPSRTKP